MLKNGITAGAIVSYGKRTPSSLKIKGCHVDTVAFVTHVESLVTSCTSQGLFRLLDRGASYKLDIYVLASVAMIAKRP